MPEHANLADRRRRAGASVEAMGAGIGLSADEIRQIEQGNASEEQRNLYSSWLDRIEAWPADERAQQLLAAIDSHRRFTA
jgi:hypothetical protein